MSDPGETATIRVLSTTALKQVLDALSPGFTRETGVEVASDFAPSGRMAKRVAEGEALDVAIVSAADIDLLIEQQRIIAGSRVDIARSAIGLAVPRGVTVPDISTPEAFVLTLLSARAIAMSHPTGGAQSGAHLARVFERLGIADKLAPKLVFGPGGPAGLVGNYLLRGEADVGLQQMSELRAVQGISIAGPIPEALQLVTVFAAGLSTRARNREAARAWIARLTASEGAAAMRANGLEPA